jgi:hypothetical protein
MAQNQASAGLRLILHVHDELLAEPPNLRWRCWGRGPAERGRPLLPRQPDGLTAKGTALHGLQIIGDTQTPTAGSTAASG